MGQSFGCMGRSIFLLLINLWDGSLNFFQAYGMSHPNIAVDCNFTEFDFKETTNDRTFLIVGVGFNRKNQYMLHSPVITYERCFLWLF